MAIEVNTLRQELTKEEAKGFLNPYLPQLAQCYLKAFDIYSEYSSFVTENAGFVRHRNTTRANLIYDYTVSIAKQTFIGTEDVTFGTYNKVFFINFLNKGLIRFKKLDDKLQSANIPTKQSTALDGQMNLSGFPDQIPIIQVGYQPNSTWTDVEEIYVLYRKDIPKWNIPIYNHPAIKELDFEMEEENKDDNIVKRVKLKDLGIEKKQQRSS